MKRNMILVSLLLLVSVGAAFGLLGREKTKPVQTMITAAPSRLRSEGRVAAYPGADVNVGTDLGGTLMEVKVQEGDEVRKGQVLALIDSRQERAALQEALSRVRESEADARFLESELHRNESLGGIISRQRLDQARNQAELGKARRDAAQATAERLRVTVSKLQILAPMDGRVVARFAQGGETVAPGAKLFQLVQTRRVRVEAEVDEFDLTRLHMGSPVMVRAEGCDASWKGHIEELPDQVVGRRLKPQDPARPSDTRVLLVKVALEEQTPLKLGQRVEVEIGPGESN